MFNIFIEIIIGIAVDGYYSGIKVGRRRWCNLEDIDDILVVEFVIFVLGKLGF